MGCHKSAGTNRARWQRPSLRLRGKRQWLALLLSYCTAKHGKASQQAEAARPKRLHRVVPHCRLHSGILLPLAAPYRLEPIGTRRERAVLFKAPWSEHGAPVAATADALLQKLNLQRRTASV